MLIVEAFTKQTAFLSRYSQKLCSARLRAFELAGEEKPQQSKQTSSRVQLIVQSFMSSRTEIRTSVEGTVVFAKAPRCTEMVSRLDIKHLRVSYSTLAIDIVRT